MKIFMQEHKGQNKIYITRFQKKILFVTGKVIEGKKIDVKTRRINRKKKIISQ